MMTIDQFEEKLAMSMATVKPRLEVGLVKVGEMAKKIAVSYIGTGEGIEAGMPYSLGWAPLADSTIASKSAAGFAVPYPLLRTGELRDSIDFAVNPFAFEMFVVVGSTDPVAVWHTHGTSRMPPRPFLAPAMLHTLPFAEEIFGKIAIKILTMSTTDESII
jgi:hypothetical protein